MFYDNLKAACEKAGLKITPTVIECGGKNGSVRNWKRGASPNSDIVIALANHLNVSTDYLLLGKESALTPEEHQLIFNFSALNSDNQIRVLERIDTLLETQEANTKEEIKMIPIRQNINPVSAGKGYSLEDEDWRDIEVPLTRESRKADYCLIVDGDSMEPEFHSGDTVLIREQPAVEIGQICIYTIGNKGFIKKFGGDRLISLNKDKEKYPDILFAEHASDYISCNGLVIGRV